MGADRHSTPSNVMGTVVLLTCLRGPGSRGRRSPAGRPLAAPVDATFAAPGRQRRQPVGREKRQSSGARVAEGSWACAAISARSGGYFTTTPGGRFDPSGYVKGWAVERAAAILTAAGPAGHSVNGGGDVQCSGDRMWRIGIADPLHPGRLALVVTGRDFAVATSGVAERRDHIIDPYTGQPPAGLASITVVGTRLAETDAYATAAFAMGAAARAWVEGLDGYEAYAITATGATWQTSGFGRYLG
jgi:thiamine biosynthesis lipoprotein